MGYMIQYNPEDNKKYPSRVSIKERKVWGVISIILCIILAFLAVKHKNIVLQWMLPGDSTVTEAAIYGLIEDLKDGVRGYDAVEAFCEEIVSNAEK